MGCAASTTHGVIDGSFAANKNAALTSTGKASPRVHKTAPMKGGKEEEESERLIDRRTAANDDGNQQGWSEQSKNDASSEGKGKPDAKKQPESQLSRVIEFDEEIPNAVPNVPEPSAAAAVGRSLNTAPSQKQLETATTSGVGFLPLQTEIETAAGSAPPSSQRLAADSQPPLTNKETARLPLAKSSAASLPSLNNARTNKQKNKSEIDPELALPKPTAASLSSLRNVRSKAESEPAGVSLPQQATPTFASVSNVRSKAKSESEPAGVPLPQSTAPTFASISTIRSKGEPEPAGVPLPKSTAPSFGSISNTRSKAESDPAGVPLPQSTAPSFASISNTRSKGESEPTGVPLPQSTSAQSFGSIGNICSDAESEPAGVPLPQSTAPSLASISNTRSKAESDPAGVPLPQSTAPSFGSISNVRFKAESEPAVIPLPKSTAASLASINNVRLKGQSGTDESEPAGAPLPKSTAGSLSSVRMKNQSGKAEAEPAGVALPRSTAASLSSLSTKGSKNPRNKADSDPAGIPLPKSTATSLASVSNIHDVRIKGSRDNLGSDTMSSSGRKSRQDLVNKEITKKGSMSDSKEHIVSKEDGTKNVVDSSARKSKDDLTWNNVREHASIGQLAGIASPEAEESTEREKNDGEPACMTQYIKEQDGDDDSQKDSNPKFASAEHLEGKTGLASIQEGKVSEMTDDHQELRSESSSYTDVAAESHSDEKDSEDAAGHNSAETTLDTENHNQSSSNFEHKLPLAPSLHLTNEEELQPPKNTDAKIQNAKDPNGVSLTLSSAQYAASSPNLGASRFAGSSQGKLDRPLGKVSVSQKHISKYAEQPKGPKPIKSQESVAGMKGAGHSGTSKSSLSKSTGATNASEAHLAKPPSARNASRSGLESASGAYGSRSRSSIRSNSKAAPSVNNLNRSAEFGSTNKAVADLGEGSLEFVETDLPTSTEVIDKHSQPDISALAAHDNKADQKYERDHEAKSLEQIAAEAADEARRFAETQPKELQVVKDTPDAVEDQNPADVHWDKPEEKDYEITE